MTHMNLFKPGRKISSSLGKTACFFVVLLFLSWQAWADIYKKINELGLECREGNEEACTELADMAKHDEDGNVRLAAADNLKDKSLAQTIFASIAKYDQDAEVRVAAVKKLTDRNLLENLAKHAKDGSVRKAAARKLNGEDLSAEVAENAESEEASTDEEAIAADEVSADDEAIVDEEASADEKEIADEEVSKEEEQTFPAAETPVIQDKKQVISGKKMSILVFELRAGINTSALLGIGGAIWDHYKNKYDMPYYDKLRLELISVSEDVLKESNEIDYISDEGSIGNKAKTSIPFDTFVKRKDLFAALSIKTSLGLSFSLKKKLVMLTVWEITNAAGHEVKIKTSCKSKKSQGMFPNVGNPELEPVWLDMARENAQQFLEKLAVIMKEDENLK